jgi:tetratricopeptide (TPR) repeat protein
VVEGVSLPALDELPEAIAALGSAGDLRLCARLAANAATLLETLGALDEAEAMARRGLALAEQLGLEHVRALAAHNLGSVLLVRGRIDEARAFQEQALADFLGQSNVRLAVTAMLELGRTLHRAGERAGAAELLRQVLGQTSEGPLRFDALSALARLELEQGDAAAATAHIEEAMVFLEHAGAARVYGLPAVLDCAEVLFGVGERARAASVVRGSWAAIDRMAAGMQNEGDVERYRRAGPGMEELRALTHALGISP